MECSDIKNAATALGLTISEAQAELFVRYYNLLELENRKHNLTRIKGKESVLYDLFFDSILALAYLGGCPAKELLDLGTGAGFPGIPIKIVYPELKLTLLDASAKKLLFLHQLTDTLGLEDIDIMHGRAETLGRGEGRNTCAWITARAVAPLPVLIELSLPLLRCGGVFWAYKGPSFLKELKEAEEITRRCGGVLRKEKQYTLPFGEKKRCLLVFEKITEGEQRFPRRPGIPQKRPFITAYPN